MPVLDRLAEEILPRFDAMDRARENALRMSRGCIRICSAAIRSVHRGEFTEAERLIDEADGTLNDVREMLKGYPEIRYAGYVDDAEQEYAEARNVYSLIARHELLDPGEIGVDPVNYLSGLGDVTGELRRHILDLIREGRPGEGEYYLETMEEIYHLLMLFDYPEAITRGLRRKSDLARSMLERTRGDLTNAVEMEKVGSGLKRIEDKLKESGFTGLSHEI